jgi:hypothetical protein
MKSKEERLKHKREYCKAYYAKNRERIIRNNTDYHKRKMEGMTDEEREAYREKAREYNRAYWRMKNGEGEKPFKHVPFR